MSKRCDHSQSEETSLCGGHSGLPVSRCLKCDTLFDAADLAHDACMDAAEMAGAEDDGWADRYERALGGLGYEVVPWPAHLQMPHAATEAHPQVKRRNISIEMIVVSNDVLEAMARACEGRLVYP